MSFSPRIVIPGDIVHEISDSPDSGGPKESSGIVLGPGLIRAEGASVRVAKPGVLRAKQDQRKAAEGGTAFYWVDSHSRRYVPTRSENVLGVVTAKAGDTFRVDIGAADQASLSYLAFEHATKKNRPNVNVGDVVYAKLLVASRDMEPELVCVDSYGKKAGLGVLTGGGFMFTVPLHLVRKLLSPDCCLLKDLGASIPFEVAVGMNGRVWLRGRGIKETICLANAISVAEFMSNEQIKRMVNKLVDALKGF